MELLRTKSHVAKNVSEEHLETFYVSFNDVKDEHFDGLIITGAPVELLDFHDVDYWEELTRIMDWSKTNVHSTLHICWGVKAGIYYRYGVEKYELDEKTTGVFEHRVVKPSSPWVRGFDDRFRAPHSRYTNVRAEDIEAKPPTLESSPSRTKPASTWQHRQSQFLRVRPPRIRPRDPECGIRARLEDPSECAAAQALLPQRRPRAARRIDLARALVYTTNWLNHPILLPNDAV